jgi:uncharacterized protein YdeI (YjbR/CyaY-like superfamily)
MRGPLKELQFSSQAEWRLWLEENHEQERGVWLVFWKKATGRRTLSHEEALEEALCLGWIDSTVRRIDEERFAFKFTPRRQGSKWSEVNKMAARKLMEEGRMTAAGRARLGCDLEVEDAHRSEPSADEVPDFMRAALEKDEEAGRYFTSLPPSHRRSYVRWVSEAKRPETRERRLEEAIQLLRKKERLGMK